MLLLQPFANSAPQNIYGTGATPVPQKQAEGSMQTPFHMSIPSRLLLHCLAVRAKPFTITKPLSYEDVLEGYRLVYQEYTRRGICPRHYAGLHFTRYSLLTSTQQYLLLHEDNVAGTISMVQDTRIGLPMESLYPDELRNLRQQGKVLGEVSALALNGLAFSHRKHSLSNYSKIRAMFSLFAAMYEGCKEQGEVTDLVIVVHPRHRAIYQTLGFEQFGPVKSYDGANGKPAFPMHASLVTIQKFINNFRLGRFVEEAYPKMPFYSLCETELNILHRVLEEKSALHQSIRLASNG